MCLCYSVFKIGPFVHEDGHASSYTKLVVLLPPSTIDRSFSPPANVTVSVMLIWEFASDSTKFVTPQIRSACKNLLNADDEINAVGTIVTARRKAAEIVRCCCTVTAMNVHRLAEITNKVAKASARNTLKVNFHLCFSIVLRSLKSKMACPQKLMKTGIAKQIKL